MPPEIPLLAPSGQSAGLFPGRGQGTPADSMYGGGAVMPDADQQVAAGGLSSRAHLSVPVMVAVALGGIILLHLGGFRFAFDASVGR